MVFSLLITSSLITLFQSIGSHPSSCTSTASSVLSNALALITRQYSHIQHGTQPLSLLLFCWALSYIVLASGYTGQLFSQKMTATPTPPFTNLDSFVDCVDDGRCKITLPTLSWAPLQMIISRESPVSIRLKKAIEKNPIEIILTNETMPAILEYKEKYLVWIGIRRFFTSYLKQNQNEACSLYVTSLPYSNNVAFAVRKNSSILRKLNRLATLYRESGLYQKYESKYLLGSDALKNLCQKKPSQEDFRVKFIEIATVFTFYICGNIFALIILIGEMYKGGRENLNAVE